MDTFSDHSIFISLHFQINPLQTAYSNVSVSMLVFNCKIRKAVGKGKTCMEVA